MRNDPRSPPRPKPAISGERKIVVTQAIVIPGDDYVPAVIGDDGTVLQEEQGSAMKIKANTVTWVPAKVAEMLRERHPDLVTLIMV